MGVVFLLPVAARGQHEGSNAPELPWAMVSDIFFLYTVNLKAPSSSEFNRKHPVPPERAFKQPLATTVRIVPAPGDTFDLLRSSENLSTFSGC